jgi:hypothetical protein
MILMIPVVPNPSVNEPMGVWQGVAMDSLKFHYAHHALPFYALWAGALRSTTTPLDTPRRTPMNGPDFFLRLAVLHEFDFCPQVAAGFLKIKKVESRAEGRIAWGVQGVFGIV